MRMKRTEGLTIEGNEGDNTELAENSFDRSTKFVWIFIFFNEYGLPTQKGKLFLEIGITQFESSCFDLTLQLCKHVLKFKYDDKLGESRACIILSLTNDSLGNVYKAIKFYKRASKIDEQDLKLACYLSIGTRYSNCMILAKLLNTIKMDRRMGINLNNMKAMERW
jgi:hypothetical protein